MPGRAESVRIEAARHVIVASIVLVGISVVAALAMMAVRWATIPGYFPRAWHNTVISLGLLLAALLSLRCLRISWRPAFVGYILLSVLAFTAMVILDHLRSAAGFTSTHIYAPHVAILLTALIAGFRPSWLIAGATFFYLLVMAFLVHSADNMGVPIIAALVTPFTALLVERLLDEVEKEAQRAQRAESSIGIMAHDLGNPLTALVSSLEMLEGPVLLPEQSASLIRAIQRSTGTLRRLVAEFREFPHLDQAPPPEMTDWRSIVNDVIELDARPMCETRGLKLAVDLESVEVVGVPSRLSRVTRELLTNAIKYTRRGGHIQVTLHAAEQAILRVSDDGWGIEPEELEHVFERGWRGDSAYKAPSSGVGLGLYICRQIVHQHGGRIQVDSQEGQGSTFTVYLPLPGAGAASPSS